MRPLSDAEYPELPAVQPLSKTASAPAEKNVRMVTCGKAITSFYKNLNVRMAGRLRITVLFKPDS
jgi:hypothetical protein